MSVTDLSHAQVHVDATQCFHCGDPLPTTPLHTTILQQPRAMCCLGCQLASQSIVDAGLENYYLDRTEISRTAPLPEGLDLLSGYDHHSIQNRFVYHEKELSCADLSIAGLRCAACSWLIEKRLLQQTGVAQVAVNLGAQRLRLAWHDGQVQISQLLLMLEQLGYTARPFRQDTHAELLAKESRQWLMRLGVAGLGAMQAMMYATAVYLGDYNGMDIEFRDYFRWVGFAVSLPVFLYAGWPFYQSAWRAVVRRSVNMDVPVSIALLLTFSASTYATLTQTGETYFDSVSMFIFFLLAGRFLEIKARQRASQTASDLITIEPILVHRQINVALQTVEQYEDIAAHDLQIGDRICVRAGESIPCDGVVVQGSSQVSEALITGEAQPIRKQVGDTVLGGSQNYMQPLWVCVSEPPESSQRALLDRLMNRALSERPQAAQRADQMAKWFVARVLVLAVLVFAVWWMIDSKQALWATVAVLVATCPCALSLATPIALTTATNRLAQLGFLLTRGHVMESLAKSTHVVFDKTGTLTQGEPVLINTTVYHSQYTAEDVLMLATALEQTSNHPIAKAFRCAYQQQLPEVVWQEGSRQGGVMGQIDGQSYRLGHAAFVGIDLQAVSAQTIYLVRLTAHQIPELLAEFVFDDLIRPDAKTTIDALKAQGVTVWMLSGDPSNQPQQIGERLAIDRIEGGLSPEQKVAQVKALQEQGHHVVMVGDGVNDGPVLATANVSIAMSSGADLAMISADSILLQDRLSAIVDAYRVSHKTDQVIAQNLRWAFFYNFAVLFPAALGYVPAWLAAIGMSLSSMLVVMSALRLRRA